MVPIVSINLAMTTILSIEFRKLISSEGNQRKVGAAEFKSVRIFKKETVETRGICRKKTPQALIRQRNT